MRRRYIVVGCAFYDSIVRKKMRKFTLENKVYEESVESNECDNIANDFRSIHTKHEIVDLKRELKNKISANMIFCSFELSCAKGDDFYKSFFTELNKYRPLFYALTSHTKNCASLNIFNTLPKNTLLHLIANDLTRTDVQNILKKALDCGLYNIFVLRGDFKNANSEFPYAADLIRFIRNHFGDVFCISVAGYPEMHPESKSKETDLMYLKEKVEAGADFIITQFFFEANIFIKFVNDCKEIGIDVPIIPGIFPIFSYGYLNKMTKICHVKIPEDIFNDLQPIKSNDDAVCNYGIELVVNIVKDIIASKTTCGFHLFTMNKPTLISKICDKLDIFH